MNRLTDQDYRKGRTVPIPIGLIGEMYEKLSKLEDIMEEFNINSAEELRSILRASGYEMLKRSEREKYE